LPCVSATGADLTCIQQSLTTLATNLTTITTRLHQADPTVATRVIGLNYYDPLLADWLQGPDGQQLATQSVDLVTQFNQILANAYTQAGYRIADVASAFQITAFNPTVTVPGIGDVPTNVATVCQLTWICTPAPIGPNIHPNATGYSVIANTVEAQLPQYR
jgi:lysophospholipase L1-like esterase